MPLTFALNVTSLSAGRVVVVGGGGVLEVLMGRSPNRLQCGLEGRKRPFVLEGVLTDTLKTLPE